MIYLISPLINGTVDTPSPKRSLRDAWCLLINHVRSMAQNYKQIRTVNNRYFYLFIISCTRVYLSYKHSFIYVRLCFLRDGVYYFSLGVFCLTLHLPMGVLVIEPSPFFLLWRVLGIVCLLLSNTLGSAWIRFGL